MYNLIKALGDEIDVTQDAVARARRARIRGDRATELTADAEAEMQFEKLRARVLEIQRKLGL
jgi:hypothetical protein